jgi:hypothetical protein
VRDKDYLKPDDDLGRAELPIKSLVERVLGGTRGVADEWFELSGRGAGRRPGRLEMRVQYRGYQ